MAHAVTGARKGVIHDTIVYAETDGPIHAHCRTASQLKYQKYVIRRLQLIKYCLLQLMILTQIHVTQMIFR